MLLLKYTEVDDNVPATWGPAGIGSSVTGEAFQAARYRSHVKRPLVGKKVSEPRWGHCSPMPKVTTVISVGPEDCCKTA